ncbi:hypothetical protein KZ686_22620 [Cupriavidus cauae]|uniref:hypothetical protein n=1 Tax=Cupriavidus cauae TaxID=2608999 RepID=UPI0022434532|nr:hypothetical protein [Cupriavidus cauae]UZN51139.1 hypothetical protein KZ686_22620 [Cupriavidus cauae]
MRFVLAALLLPLALLWSTAIVALALALVLGAVAFGVGCRTAAALGDLFGRAVRARRGARRGTRRSAQRGARP